MHVTLTLGSRNISSEVSEMSWQQDNNYYKPDMLLLPLTTNETLFTDNYTKTPTNTPSPFRLCITHIVQLRLVNSQ